ncbi:Legume-like lectin [Purpureocillium lavendulum]|uniref:Legume-like lectin n=1 Tax=Purpureocillium lavendulum TaxID=1247861 RepID=A0AB34G7M8_9HYPO|nr:Legume-like lectin [Purpureocillium lavendulum]
MWRPVARFSPPGQEDSCASWRYPVFGHTAVPPPDPHPRLLPFHAFGPPVRLYCRVSRAAASRQDRLVELSPRFYLCLLWPPSLQVSRATSPLEGHTEPTMRLPSISAALVAALAWTVRGADDHRSDLKSITTGWLFSRVPLTATNWEVEVEFKITGKNQLYGDGFAMWITKQRAQQGPVFGSTDRFEGLGIFVDTYKNNRPGVVFPYVMAMFGDGQTSYDKNTDGRDQELAGCSARGIRHASVPTKMRLTYIQDKQLRLELQYKTEDEWELCFETDKPPAIPNIAYLGFSAETGELSDNHDIISVSAKNLYSAPGAPITPSKGKNKGTKGYSSKEGGSWTWFFTKIFLFMLVAGAGYVGFTAYRAKAKSHRF